VKKEVRLHSPAPALQNCRLCLTDGLVLPLHQPAVSSNALFLMFYKILRN
jgi:hypothetical protein